VTEKTPREEFTKAATKRMTTKETIAFYMGMTLTILGVGIIVHQSSEYSLILACGILAMFFGGCLIGYREIITNEIITE